jgi:hypothetical protein
MLIQRFSSPQFERCRGLLPVHSRSPSTRKLIGTFAIPIRLGRARGQRQPSSTAPSTNSRARSNSQWLPDTLSTGSESEHNGRIRPRKSSSLGQPGILDYTRTNHRRTLIETPKGSSHPIAGQMKETREPKEGGGGRPLRH